MEDPEFVSPDLGVEEVAERFSSSENTLLVRDGGELKGEIHEHSLLKALIPEGRLDEEKVVGILGLSFHSEYVAETASDLMNRHEVTVEPGETLEEIAFVLDREDIRSVPVEEDGEIIGVVHEDRVVEEI